MALDPTAREANFKDSIKKYLVDNLKDIEDITLSFDKSMSYPNLQGVVIDRWVNVRFGPLDRATMSSGIVEFFCGTREDNEGYKLSQLVDRVYGYLTDENASHGMKSIPFYRSYRDQAWDLIGGILIQEIRESSVLEAPDESKYKILTVTCRFASKL